MKLILLLKLKSLSIKKAVAPFIILLLLFSGSVSAQISTTVTMNGIPIANSPFSSLANAINGTGGLNTLSITGPVLITCGSGAETAPTGGYSITNKTGTSVNTITILGAGAANTTLTAPTWTGSGVTDCIIKIIGGDYITIDGFKIQENSANSNISSGAGNTMTEAGIGIFAFSATDGAQYNTIKNCIITLNNNYANNVGIFSTCNTSSINAAVPATSSAGTNSFTKIYSNNISNSTYGIFITSPANTSTLFETGIDIGGSSATTGNTITFGNATTAIFGWTTGVSHTICAGIVTRNGAGNSIKYNTITSNDLNYGQSSGIAGVHLGQSTVISGQTYTSTVSNNTITLTNSGPFATNGINFGFGISTGTIIANNNIINLTNTTSFNIGDLIGINSGYTSSSITTNENSITLNQSLTSTGTVVWAASTPYLVNNIVYNNPNFYQVTTAGTSTTTPPTNTTGSSTAGTTGAVFKYITNGSVYGIDNSGLTTSTVSNKNTIVINQTTSSIYSNTSPIRGIKASTAATTLTIGSSGNGNTITIKQAITGSGAGYSGTIYHIDGSAAHGTANINYNILNTVGGTLLSTGACNTIRHEGNITTLTIDNNTINITRASNAGTYRGTNQSTSFAGGSQTITNNAISIVTTGSVAPNGSIVGMLEQGAISGTRNINGNTISITGTNTDYNYPISVGNGTGTINSNSITVSTASSDTIGINAIVAGTGAYEITGNTLSLTSSSTTPSNMTAISGGGTGPFQIYNNTFTALNLTGIVTSTHTVNGIAVSAGSGNNIYNNHITNISDGAANSTGASTINGVLISGGTSTNVYKNKIQGIATTSTNGVSLINGISITGGTTNTVYNNLIGNLTPSASTNVDGIRGISITSTTVSSTNNIYYNTIAIGGSGGGTSFGSSGIYHAASATASTAALNLINNIITNNCTPSGLGIAVAFRRSGTNLENYASTSNNNLFYGGVLMNDGTNSYTTIGALKTLLSTRDQNSITENPTFQSTTGSSANFLKFDLTTPTQIESGAVNILTYTTDYVGTIRQGNASSTSLGTAPDIGAWELDGTVAVVMRYTSSTTEQLTGNAYVNQNNQAIIRVKIVTTGATNPLTLTSLSLNANGTTDINDINSSTAKIYYTTNTTFSTASLFGGTTPNTTSFDVTGSQELVEGDNYFWLTYDIIAGATQSDLIDGECTSITISSASQTPTTSAPSGSKTIQSAMSGNYDVGVSQTYATLTAASNDINLRGVSGAVTFTLASDYSSVSETFPITINQYTGVSATNTLTIKPGTGVTAVISGTPSLSNPLLQLLGADYVTIDGSNDGTTSRNLTFTNTGITGLTSGIQLSSASASNGATYNVIKNCKFDAGSYGIISGGLSLSANAIAPLSNNSIVNNEFIKMNYGINIQGYAVTPYDANWVINNNMFGSTTTPANYLIIRAIRIDNASNFLISNNTISGIHNSATNALYGIYMGGAYATGDIKNNTISNIKKNAVDNSGVYGIYSTSSTSNNNISIYNNSISDLIPYGSISSTATTCGGIYFTGAGNSGYKIYNNTISISGTHPVSGTSTTTSHCIYFSSALNVASGFDIRNNIFSNTSTSGNRFSFSSFSLTAIFSTISHNNYFSSGTSLGNSGGTAYTTLTNLMSALSSTVGNLNVLPSFTSTTNLHLTTTGNCSLNNSGTPLGTVTTDMDGDTRSTSTPDIGADEFSGVNNTSSAASANPTLCSNTALTNITHTTTGATGIGSYTGLPSGVSAAWATNTITISGTPSASGIFNYTIPLTVPTTGGCTTVNATGTITVNPNPTALVLTGSSTCPSTNGSITSSTSVSGANYQLYDSSDATLGSSVAGTGSGLSWSSIAIGTGYYAITTNSTTSCISSNSNSVDVSTITDKTWIGPGNWNTPANWSCGSVPTSSNTIIISSGSPQLDTDFTVAGSLTLSGTGSLTINPTQTLTISGTANFAGKSVTIKSDATGTGAIGQITGTLTGATNVTVERYIPAKRAWRALTTPLKGSDASIFSQWQNNGTISSGVGVELWGPAGDATPSSSNSGLAIGPNSSILQYNNTGSGAWSTVANTNSTKLFTTTGNNAFMVFPTGGYGSGLISSNSTPLALDTTLKATGQLITGQVDYFSLPSASHTLIGNPYASPIDIATMLGSNADFNGNVWVWDANAAGVNTVGTYNLFDSGTYTNLTSDTAITSGTQIQSGQAFFVKPLTNLSTFTIQEAHKGSVFSNAVFRNAHSEILRVGLYKQTNNQWSGRDGAMTVFLSDAEANQIANKMANGSENIAFTKNGAQFASNHHLPLVASDVLNVKVWNTTAGSNYKLKINTEQFNTTNLNATLEDAFTNSRTPIALNGTAIEYPFSVTTDVASSGNRFKIVFETNALGISNPKTGGITVLPNPIIGDAFQVNLGTLEMGTYSYSICTALGQEVEKGSINKASQNENYGIRLKNNTAAGMYIIKVTDMDNNVFTAKLIKQ